MLALLALLASLNANEDNVKTQQGVDMSTCDCVDE